MINCPCGYGKNIPENQKSCPVCGTDLTPLHHLKGLPQSIFEEGKKRAEEGDGNSAVEKLLTAITLDPELTEAHVQLADIYMETNRLNEALAHYQKALKNNPNDKEIREKIKKAETRKNKISSPKFFSKSMFFFLPAAAFILGLSIFPLSKYFGKNGEQQINPVNQANEIKEKIYLHPDLQGMKIEVQTQNSGLFLSGEVPSKLHKSLIREILTQAAADCPVDLQNIAITPPAEKPEKKPMVFTYTVRPNDSLALIASIFYGDSSLWTKIFQANRDRIKSPQEISVGQVLFIPLNSK